VLPEAVTYEENGKDARSVDYNRLTAVLIEAVKQQQAEITNLRAEGARQQAQLTKALRQIKSAQALIHRQETAIAFLRAQVRPGNEGRRINARLSVPEQPILVASR
jgi:flagellar biosynthesis chaperone FliJ